MSDFFNDNKQETNIETEERIKIGDQDFSPKELEEMVGIANQVKDVETKYNTKMDRVFPEYIKTTQELKESRAAKAELEALKATISNQNQIGGGLTQDQITQAREQLYQIMGGKPIIENDFDTKYTQKRSEERAVENLLNDVERLNQEVLKDEKPKFDKKDLLEFMDQTGITNPEAAYKIKYEKEIDDWKVNKLSRGRRVGLNTITSSQAGGKQPLDVRPSTDNLMQLVQEALGGSEEE